MKITQFPSLKDNWKRFLVFFILLVFLYMFISQLLMAQNFYPNVDQRMLSRILLDKVHSRGFLESDSFDIPLFLYYSLWFFPQWPAFFSIIVGAFVISFLIVYVLENFKTPLIKIVFSSAIALLPSSVYVISNQPMIALLMFFFSLALYFLLEFYQSQRVFYLFLSAIAFGLQFYIQFHFFWLGLLLILFFAVSYWKTGLIINYLITILFPLLFFLLSWFFLIWVFRGDLSRLSTQVFSLDLKNGINCLFQCFQTNLISRWPIMLFYLYILFRVGRYRSFYRSPLFLAFMAPFILIFILGTGGNQTSTSAFIILSLMNLIILFPYLGPLVNEKRQKVVIAIFLIFIFAYDVCSFLYLRRENEGAFLKAFQGEYKNESVAEYRIAASQLTPFHSVLTDTEYTYPIFCFYEGNGTIITKGSPLYQTAMANPAHFAQAYLVDKQSMSISQDSERLSEAYGYRYYESERFIIFSTQK